MLFAVVVTALCLVLAAGSGVAAAETTAQDSGPTAEFEISPTDPDPDEEITFDASASQASSSIESYDWDLGDSEGYSSPSGERVEDSYDEYGEYEVELTVTDEEGRTDTTTKTVVVDAEGPTADFEFTPEAPKPDERIVFDASMSDAPAGSIESYDWYMPDVDGYSSPSGESVTASYDEHGEYEVELVVTDNGGKTDRITKTVVVDAAAPTASFEYSPSDPAPDEQITFDAAGSDAPAGSVESYDWRIPEIDGHSTPTGETVTGSFEEYGEYEVTLTVTDNGGKTDTTTKTVAVNAEGPTARIEVTPSSPRPDERVTFDGSESTAPAGEIESYDWTLSGIDGHETPTGERVDGSYETYGTYQVVLEVTDNGGKTDRTTERIRVNAADPIAEFEYSPTDPAPDEEITFDASPSAAFAGSVESYEWELSGVDGHETPSGERVTGSYEEYGEYEVTLTITDNGGKTARVTRTVSIDGPGPTAAFEMDPEQPDRNQRVVFDGSPSNGSGAPITEYRWFIDGDRQRSDGDRLSRSFTEYGVYDVELEVEDSGGKTDRTTRTVTIGDRADRIDNPEFSLDRTAPQSRSIEASTGDELVFRAEVDSRSLPVATARLLVDGSVVEQSELNTSTIRLPRRFETPGEHTVELELVDPAGQSAVVEWTVSVRGEKPEISEAVPAVDQIRLRTGDSQQFELVADSSQREDIEYSWELDGTPTASGQRFEREFTTPGEYVVTGILTGEGGRTVNRTWRVGVQSFRSTPTFSGYSSTEQVTVDGGSQLLTFSVRNPDVNDRPVAVEIVTELPDGLSISGARDITESDAGMQALVGLVEPGRQESMRLTIQVEDDSLAGETVTIPYQVRYYPEGSPEEFQTDLDQEIRLAVEADTSDGGEGSDGSGPGFGLLTAVSGFAGIGYLLNRRRQ